ncbi:uncharacterized protein si:ch73-347e22.4 [Pygocentrus nattereri]|uniref:uncharacterized protein si:ch73-347e22.4 n=1 Tax=Pygocentrus nattereri TaxID=42514 RepID=UPI0018916B45|nr:uncharacterized protein si:ch73-347e22.4 [Pygocentrus nattereri]XP_037388525.1 uncharacterized protein si:ch73-347e22.4 [Pygocentrus nattereri]
MNDKFPPWNAQRGYSHGKAYGSDTLQKCQGLDNANDVSPHCGEATTDGNYEEQSRDFSRTSWPQTSQHEGTDMRGIQSVGHASSYTSSASNAFSSDGQGIPSGIVNYPYYRVSPHPMRSNMGHITEHYGEGTAKEMRKRDHFINDSLAAASTNASNTLVQETELEKNSSSNWTSVIKEALEMSNGVGLEQDVSCGTSVVYEEAQSETRGTELLKDHFDPVDCQSQNDHENCKTEEMIGAQDSSVIVLFDGMKITPIKSSQDLQQREVNSLNDGFSVNDKVHKKTSCGTTEQCSSLGFYNTTEICSLEQHAPTKQKSVSGFTIRSCLSDNLSTIRTNVEKQSENLVELVSTVPSTSLDITGNREGTLSPAVSQLRQISKEHAESYKNYRRYVDSQTKLCEDYCSKGNNAILPRIFNVPGKNLKPSMTQRPIFQSNVPDNISQTGQHEWAGSEMKLNFTITENQKPVVAQNELVVMEENWSSNITEGTNTDDGQNFPLKLNVQNEKSNTVRRCAFTGTSAEPSSVCSSTPVSQLENFVHNLYKEILPTPTLKSLQPFHIRTDTTKETATKCEDSDLPPRQEQSLNMASNAECTLTKQTRSTSRTACFAVRSPQKDLVKNQVKPNKWEKTGNGFSTQEASTFQDSAAEPGDLASDKVPPTKAAGKDCLTSPKPYKKQPQHDSTPSFTSENVSQNSQNALKKQKTPSKRKALDGEALTCHTQKRTCEIGNYSPITNLENVPSEGLTKEVNTTDVSQCTREKQKKPENSCGSLKKSSHLLEEQPLGLYNVVKMPTAKQECSPIALTEKEESNADLPETARSQIVSQQEDCLPLISTSAAQKSVKAKAHATKFTNKTTKDVTLEDDPLSCEPADSILTSENSDLRPRNTSMKFKKTKNSKIKNKTAALGCVHKCPALSTDKLSSFGLFEDVNATHEIQNSGSKSYIRRCSDEDVSIDAKSKADDQNSLQEPVQQNAKADIIETYGTPDACLSMDIVFPRELDNTFQLVSDIKTEPMEVRNYLKKLRKRKTTSENHSLVCKSTKNVKLESDIYPQGCRDLPVTHFENVSDFLEKGTVSVKIEETLEDGSPSLAKNDLKMVNLKSIKAHVLKRKRARRPLRKRKLMKLAKPLSEALNTETITAKGLQKISQNVVPGDLMKTDVNFVKTQMESSVDSSRKSCCARQSNSCSSIQTRSTVNLVLEDPCESPEQKQTILSHPVTRETMDNHTSISNCKSSSSDGHKSRRRQPKKQRRSARSRTNTAQTALICKAEKTELESPEQKQTILSHPVATRETVDNHTSISNCKGSSSAGQKSQRRQPKKQRRSARSRTNAARTALVCKAEKTELEPVNVSKRSRSVSPVENNIPPLQISYLSASTASAENETAVVEPTNLMKQKISQTCRKRTLSKIGLQNYSPEQRVTSKMVNSLQALPVHAKKGGKMSKTQLSNVNISSLRYSRRLSRFTPGEVRSLQKPGNSAADDSISSKCHSVLLCEVRRKSRRRKNRKHNKKKSVQIRSNTNESLPKSSCDIMDNCLLTSTCEEKDQKTNEDSSLDSLALCGHHLKVSEGKVIQVATRILPRTMKLKREKDQGMVADTKLLENSSETLANNGEMSEEKFGQLSLMLKQPPSMIQCGESPGVKAELKNKRKMSKKKAEQVSKRMELSQEAKGLQLDSSKDLGCFERPLKMGIANGEQQSANVFRAVSSKMLLSTAVEEAHFALSTALSSKSENKDIKGRESKKKTRWHEKKKDASSTESNRGDAFELSLKSSANTIGFHPSKIGDAICDDNIKEEKYEKVVTDTSIRASDLEVLARDVTVENAGLKAASEGTSPNFGDQNTGGFIQYFKDFIATLNIGTCAVDDAAEHKKAGSLPRELAKKFIICKYCGQSFRHISAYTVHQRIHTGEKPYRCKLCGKNFAHLSKLKSHRKNHTQPEALRCPCCSKTFSRKQNFVSHFKIHLQETKQKNGPDRDMKCKDSAPLTSPFRDDTSLLCEICDKNFTNKFMLKIHMHMHDGKSLSCTTCGKKFQEYSNLQVHEKTHWLVKPYACSICGKVFKQLKALKKHSQGHTGETPFSCSHCGCAFHDLSALRVHQVFKQCAVNGKINGGNCDNEGFLVSQGIDSQVNTPVFFKCQICKLLCRKWCQYTLHLETHTKAPPYLCFTCGQSYAKDSDISIHCKICCQSSGEEVACRASISEIFSGDTQKYTSSLNTSTLNPHSVKNCKTKNNSLSNESHSQDSQASANLQWTERLNPHEFIEASLLPETNVAELPIHLHSGSPSPTPEITCVSLNDSQECIEISPRLGKFECPRCGQQYEQYRTLHAHMQTHAHGYRYVCGPCGQSFERWNRLWLHQRIHRRKRRFYSCSQCNLQFRFIGSYKGHMLDHAGQRPFACPVCPETFVHGEALHAHQCEFHQFSKILQCDVCGKTFSNLRNLLKHSRLHNGVVSHQCLACKLSFTNSKILQEHLKSHQNKLGLPLPDIPSQPLAFLHKCKKCEACFSTGDLLYAHQICHFGGQLCPTHINKSTSSVFEGSSQPHTESPSHSTTRPLLSTLNLDTIPNDERLYTYPHPDKLYVMPSLSRTRLPLINLDSDEEENTQPASSDQASANISMSGSEGQRIPESTQDFSETNTTHLPQALESPESSLQSQSTECMPAPCTITSNVENKVSHDSVTQTDNFVETSVFLEDPTTTANREQNEELEESFECADCSYRANSLLGLHEHYFLHAFGN